MQTSVFSFFLHPLFLFNCTPPTNLYTHSLHDALPISPTRARGSPPPAHRPRPARGAVPLQGIGGVGEGMALAGCGGGTGVGMRGLLGHAQNGRTQADDGGAEPSSAPHP